MTSLTAQHDGVSGPVRTVTAAACVAVTWFWWAGTPTASGATPGTALVAISELADDEVSGDMREVLAIAARACGLGLRVRRALTRGASEHDAVVPAIPRAAGPRGSVNLGS